MKLSLVLKWSAVILLLLAVAAGGALCWVWINSDRLVHSAVLDAIRKKAPGWDVTIQRTRFDGGNQLHVFEIAINNPEDGQTLASIPEAIVTVDRALMLNNQQIRVTDVVLRRPRVSLARTADGRWNWQGLPPLQVEHKNLPEWTVEDAQLEISLDYGSNFPTAEFTLHGTSAKLVPASSRSYDFRGDVTIEDVGHLAVVGDWNLDKGAWKVTGRMNDLVGSDRLMNLASNSAPAIRQRVQGFHEFIQQTAGRMRDTAPRSAEAPSEAAAGGLQIQSGDAPAFGIAGLMDVRFDIAASQRGAEPKFRVLLDLRDGTISNTVLPFALQDVNAQVYRDNDLTFVHVRNASNDRTRIELEVAVGRNDSEQPVGFVRTRVHDVPLDNRLRRVLPQSILRMLAPLHATGDISLAGTLRATGAGRWVPENCRMDVRNGTSLFEKFQYPVDQIAGSIVQRDATQTFDIDMHGMAGVRPATMTGWVVNPGPTAEMRLNLAADGVPLDKQFRAAWGRAERDIIDALDVEGFADARVAVYRPPVTGAKPEFRVDATITNGRMRLVQFPLPIDRISGQIVYNSGNHSWLFEQLDGHHGDTHITADGWINGESQPHQLHLDVAATNGTFTPALRAALGAGQQELWDQMHPAGRFDLEADIDWAAAAGHPVFVTLPRVVVRNGRLRPECFPWLMSDVAAELSYKPTSRDNPGTGQVLVKRFTARHGNTGVEATAWATHAANGDWTLHFDRLDATNVVASNDLLRALPVDLRDAFQVLNPTAPFGVENTELEFRGRGDPTVPVTAAWYCETVLDGGAISAGMDLRNVRGRVTNQGTWGPVPGERGLHLHNAGDVRLTSVEVLEHTLTNVRGPYRIVNSQLVIGSPEVFRRSPETVPASERVTATAFTGKLTCDALVSLSEPSAYRVFVTASDADLREYARIHMPAERNMSGKMNGWVYLYGLGTAEDDIRGEGQLQISPAAIYELPVAMQVLNALGNLNFAVPDRAAFRYALMNFKVRDRAFVFDQIDLAGQSLALRGRGHVDFDGRLGLEFYSKPPRAAGGIPIISQLVSGATSTWVQVRVDGTLDQPRTRVQPNINLDEALQPFLQAFDPMMNAPQLRTPFTSRPGRPPPR